MAFDFRKQWLKERVLTFLSEENNTILFDNLLIRKAGAVESLLDEFFNEPLRGSHDHKRIVVFFYKTYYDKTVLEEVDVQEEVVQPDQPAEPESEVVIVLTTEPKRKKSKANIKKKRRGSKKPDERSEVNESSALHAHQDEPDPGISADLQSKDATEDRTEDEGDQETQSADEGEKDVEKKKEKKGKKDKDKAKKSKKGRRSPITLVEEAPKLPTPPPAFVTVKKVVTKIVPAPQLHCHFGAVNGNKADLNLQYVYFVRQCCHAVPLTDTWEEAVAEMPLYFLIGSMNGNFLPGLQNLVKQVFIPLISYQFQDPLLELKLKSRAKEDGETHYPPTIETFCRPSDFWRMAVKMKQRFSLEEAFLEGDKGTPLMPLTIKRKSLMEEEDSVSSVESEIEEQEDNLRLAYIEESTEGAIDLDELVAAHLGMPIGEITSNIRRKSSATSVTSRRTSAFQINAVNKNSMCEPLKLEMLLQLESLVRMIDWTQNHLIGDVSLPAPEVPELKNAEMKPETLSKNEEIVKKLEDTVKLWIDRIKKNLESITSKKPVDEGPITEYTYWYELEAELSVLQEQLNAPTVLKVIDVLSFSNSEYYSKFKEIESDLEKHFVQTCDNVRFLSTTLCHFKVLMESNSLSEIKSCLYDLMEGLRIIWYLSVYFSVDENMATLLKRIKWALCTKVKTLLDLSQLFKKDLKEVETLTSEAAELLTLWKQCYLDIRMKIETTGTSVRWEFNKEMLFSESDYMAAVANDLNHVAKVMLEFHNIFGAELKSIISDPVQIDAVVKKVESMCHPIVKADFEVFCKDSKEHWEGVMHWFENQVIAIENDAKFFINESFTLLRCSEEALEILQKFSYIKTRPAIQNQLQTKFEPILHQFMKEVATIENLFQSQRASPPLLRNLPHVSGSIYWERYLFYRIKRPILAFQKVDAINALSFKKTVFEEYLMLVKQMKEYEDEKFEKWSKKVVALVKTALEKEVIELIEIDRFVDLALNDQSKKTKENYLRLISLKHLKQLRSKTSKSVSKFKTLTKKKGTSKKQDKIEDSDFAQAPATSMSPFALTMKWLTQGQTKEDAMYSTKYGNLNPPAKIKQIHTMAWGEFIQDALLIELKLGVRLNFTERLFEVIAEAKLMEQLGFKLPSLIEKLIAIEIPLFDAYTIVKNMVDEYCALVSRLDVPQLLFAKDHLRDVENQLHPGLVRINWTSLQIKDYAQKVLLKTNNLKNLVEQMDSCREKLDQRMYLIGSFDLFSLTVLTGTHGKIHCFDFFEKLETIQTEKMGKILGLYKLLGPILMKLESTVLQTNTGKSPFMIFYYTNCEKKIFHTFIDMCEDNLKQFKDFLSGNNAVIMIEAQLGTQDVYLEPNFVQIYNLLILTVRCFMENFKKIPRWMHGTCLLCPEVFSEDKSFKHLPSFYDDLIEVKIINDLLLQTKDTAHHLVQDLSRYMFKWRKYQTVWLLDKDANVDKFAGQNPKFNAYEEKFIFYSDLLNELSSIETFIDIQCVRIDLTKLIDSLKAHLVSWKNKLGEKLANDTKRMMNDFKLRMIDFKSSLETGVSEVVSFKIVLQAIADIKLLIVDAELIFDEIDERYHIMTLQNIPVSKEDRDLFLALKSDWDSLLDLSMYRKLSLEPAKSVFAKITENEIKKFGEETIQFTKRYFEEGPGSIKKNIKVGEQIVAEWRTLFTSMNSQREEMLKVEKLFDLPKFNYVSYLTAVSHFRGMGIIYELYHRQKASREQWGKMSWLNLNAQVLLDGIEVYLQEFKRLPIDAQSLEAGEALEMSMLQFKDSIPLFIKLKNEAIRSRHWKELMNRTGKYFNISSETFNLQCVFEMELYNHKQACNEVINNALKELTIEQSIKEIVSTWETMQLQVVEYDRNNNSKGYMLGNIGEILSLLEDHTITLQSMAGSDFVGSFLSIIKKWEVNLSNVSEVLDEWVHCQAVWLYLGVGVFSNSAVAAQLHEEKKIFDGVNQVYEKIMLEAFQNPRLLDQCLNSSVRTPEFKNLTVKLEQCRKSLGDILEKKRSMFPRFFFLSDDELLTILGSLKPCDVQKYLTKLFDNIKSWMFTEKSPRKFAVTGVASTEGETLALRCAQPVAGQLEEWMKSVTNEICKTNWHLTKKAIYDYSKVKQSRTQWILGFQGTVIYSANSVWWTKEVENVFSNIKKGEVNAMKDYLNIQNEQLIELSKNIHDLTNLQFQKVSNMIIVDVHSRNTIETFVQNNVISIGDFQWKKQLRFYWKKSTDNLIIEQCSTVLSYGFEYCGMNERLIITPSSDRFYLTVTQALYFHLGASPVGFAGTGKSEMVKDLAKTLGLLCVVIHCNSAMNYCVFHQFLKGLSQCGAWGCFENLNEVSAHILSTVSILVQSIFSASKNKLEKFLFDSQELNFNDKVNLFITLNPSYLQDTSLPESLKSLFRPVACTVPDLKLISFVSLYSKGFSSAKVLSRKITVLFKLAAVKLSNQAHYDFGIRTLKPAIATAAVMKKSVELEETIAVVQALKKTFWPRLIEDDVQLFNELLKDIFSEVYYQVMVDSNLLSVIKMSLQESGYILIDKQIEKCALLYNMLQIHHSCMLVGPSGGGKTVIFKMLEIIQKHMNLSAKIHIINPKSFSVKDLYGYFDPNTKSWNDGVLISIIRIINIAAYKDEKKYILFDGEIDSSWIENLSSVIDQTKLLSLGNGERIRLMPHCSLLFEVSHLRSAPPAIIPNFGLIYICPSNLGYEPFWKRWINQFYFDENVKLLKGFAKKYLAPVLDFIFSEKDDAEKKKLPVQIVLPLSSLNMVTQFCFIMDILLVPFKSKKKVIDPEILEALFIEGLYASFGAVVVAAERNAFDVFVKKLTGFEILEEDETNSNLQCLPSSRSLFDCYVNVKNKSWSTWEECVSPFAQKPHHKFSDVFVPIADSTKLLSYLNRINKDVIKPTVFVSEGSTYKTALMHDFLRNLSNDQFVQLKMSFSSQTSSAAIQSCIDSVVAKRTKRMYGPVNKKLVCFFDDLNAPKADEHGVQQAIAFLRLLYEKGGFYHRGENIQWRNIKDAGYYLACTLNGADHNVMDPRFLSLVYVHNVTHLSDCVVSFIFSTILKNHTADFCEDIRTIVPDLIKATLEMFQILKETIPPIPHKFHYTFTMRDLSRIMAGLCLTTSSIFTSAKQFLRVWRNEFTRVACDRLVTKEDNTLIQDTFGALIKKYFPGDIDFVLRDPLLFGDFCNAVIENENVLRHYEDLLDYDATFHLFEEVLLKYNQQNPVMQLVLFNDALEHLTRLQRIFRMKNGHVMFLGPSGTGKRNLIRLAAFTASCEVFNISHSLNYTTASFRKELKQLLFQASISKKNFVLLLDTSQMMDKGFYQILNEIVSTCISPTFFDEKDKQVVISEGRGELSDGEIWSKFLATAIENIHVAITVSLATNDLRNLCQRFPGLLKNMHVNWSFSWPTEAFSIIAETFLAHQDLLPDKYVESVTEQLVHAHTTIEKYIMEYCIQFQKKICVTPSNFFNCIHTYLNLLEERHDFLLKKQQKLFDGISKINEVFEHSEELKAKLAIHSFMISEKIEEIQKIVEDTNTAENVAEEVKEEVSERQKEMEVISQELMDEKCKVDEISSRIAPALFEAKETLRHLDNEDISEICSFAAPPEVVQNIGECVSILLGAKEISWKRAKSVMSEPHFLSNLINLDCNVISQKQQQACRVHMKPSKKMETLKDISKAGYTFYLLLEEILSYCSVFKEIKSKNKKIQKLEEELRVAQSYITQLTFKMKEVSVTLSSLHSCHTQSVSEKKKLESEKAEIEKKMASADELVSVLNPRYTSWKEESELTRFDRQQIVGDCLICSLFLSYAGPFNQKFRHDIIYTDWLNNIINLNIPVTHPFLPEKILLRDSVLCSENFEDSQLNEFETQNRIIIERARLFPVCIDPQHQAFEWIKKYESSLKITSFTNKDYLTQLENALKTGSPLLFQDVNIIDPVMNNILDKKLIRSEGQTFILLGEKQIEFNPNFKLYFTTLVAFPNFQQIIFTKTTVIDFSITQQGVSDRLLSLILELDDNSAEKERNQLAEGTLTLQRSLKKLNYSFIKTLLKSSERILDHPQEIQPLLELNHQILMVHEKLEKIKAAMEQVEKKQQFYASAAQEVAPLFFIFVEASLIDSIYQYSLETFLTVFRACLKQVFVSGSDEKCVSSLSKALIYAIYKFGCLSVHKEHELFFLFQIAVKVDQFRNGLSLSALSFFTADFRIDSLEQSPVIWLSSKDWHRVLKLSRIYPQKFQNLPADIEKNSGQWKNCRESGGFESVEFLSHWSETLIPFEKLALLSCFCPDQICDLIRCYVSSILGSDFLSPSVMDIANAFKHSCSLTPILIIHNSNLDPLCDISRLFKRNNCTADLKLAILNQKPKENIFHLLKTVGREGGWLVIQHCHQAIDILNELEEQFYEIKFHADFRLWLTSDLTPNFPLRLLCNSIKVCYEPATDLKSNLVHMYSQMGSELSSCDHPAFKRILYVLTFFHAVVQERGKYGKIGWNIPYEFTKSDFDLSVCIIASYSTEAFETSGGIPWSTIKYLMDEILYGGRVVEEHDKNVLNTIVDEYFGEFLFDQFQGFHFYQNDSVDYNLPSGHCIEDYLKSIHDLPAENYPGVFGFHENTEVRQNAAKAAKMWGTLKKFQQNETVLTAASSIEKLLYEKVKVLLSKLIRPFDIVKIRSSYKMVVTPTATVLLQELKVFNLLLRQMSCTLINLQKALTGETSMDEYLENISICILSNNVPKEWHRYSPESVKSLGGWMQRFEKRKAQFLDWSVRGDPVVIWLSGLLTPQSYIMALLQTTCQKKSWLLDRSSFYTVVTKFMSESEVEERPEIGCFIEGIFIEGGHWDSSNECLAESRPKMLIEEMPIIMIQPIEVSKLKLENTLRTPVYKTPKRSGVENRGVVFEADLKSDKHQSFWILSGVCLMLNSDIDS